MAAPTFSWRLFFSVALRLALAASVLFVLIAMPIGVLVYRARSQAAVIADLEARGCHVGYAVEYIDDPGSFQEFFQMAYGNEYFGDVDSVTAYTLQRPEHAAAICRQCAKFDKLETFAMVSNEFRFEQIAKWPQLNRLKSLDLQSDKITDADLARIGQMPDLWLLSISSNAITEAGLQQLNGLTQLESLQVMSANFDGAGPANKTGFPNLTRLTLSNAVTLHDQSVIKLGPLPELTQVDFDGTPLGDQALEHVASGGKLETVYLDGTKVTDAGMAYLAGCPKLSALTVVDTALTDAGVEKLAGCLELSFLNVGGTKTTGKGFQKLRGENFTLAMDRTDLADAGLDDVLGIQGLKGLIANDAKITGVGAERLIEPQSLNWVELSGNPLTTAGLKVLARAKVSGLVVSKTPLDDLGLMLFVANDHITNLDVSETKVTASGAVAFYEARKLRLEAAGKKETLTLGSDFPDVVEPYLPKEELLPDGGPPDFSPSEPGEPPPGEQPAENQQPPGNEQAPRGDPPSSEPSQP